MITHIVLLRPKPGLTIEEKRALAAAVRTVCREAPSVRRFEIGRVVDVGAGYFGKFGYSTNEYAAVIEFENRDGLLAYLNHPAHAKVAELFWRACESTTIVDSETLDDV